MESRVNYQTDAPGPYKAMLGIGEYLRTSGLDETLERLISLRTP